MRTPETSPWLPPNRLNCRVVHGPIESALWRHLFRFRCLEYDASPGCIHHQWSLNGFLLDIQLAWWCRSGKRYCEWRYFKPLGPVGTDFLKINFWCLKPNLQSSDIVYQVLHRSCAGLFSFNEKVRNTYYFTGYGHNKKCKKPQKTPFLCVKCSTFYNVNWPIVCIITHILFFREK